MNNEAKEVTKGQYVLTLADSDSDLPDYEMLPAEEPIKVNISSMTTVQGKWPDPDTGELKPQIRFALKVAEGQTGAGQVYSLWVNAPTSNTFSPKSALFKKIVSKIYPDGPPENFDISDLLGKPLRIELTEPLKSTKDPERKLQWVSLTKSPTKDQKELVIDTAPKGLTAQDEIDAEIKAAFGS